LLGIVSESKIKASKKWGQVLVYEPDKAAVKTKSTNIQISILQAIIKVNSYFNC
jgi:hypothetical protein